MHGARFSPGRIALGEGEARCGNRTRSCSTIFGIERGARKSSTLSLPQNFLVRFARYDWLRAGSTLTLLVCASFCRRRYLLIPLVDFANHDDDVAFAVCPGDGVFTGSDEVGREGALACPGWPAAEYTTLSWVVRHRATCLQLT